MPLNFVAKAAITVAMTAANAALMMSRRIEGPRLDDTSFTNGDYGASIPRGWGMFRISPPVFWGEDLKEVRRRRKTKGGKFNEYTYYGTWAVALACHEIAGIRRIWFDTHLVFDLSGAGPVTPFDFGDRGIVKDENGPLGVGIGGTNYGDNVALYLGTETQESDPRIQATIEAKHGEGSCPAYRGIAYLVFKDIPLEKIGNRIPQVSVEVVVDKTNSYPSEALTLGTAASHATFSADYSVISTSDRFNYALIDVAARSLMLKREFDIPPREIFDGHGMLGDGTLIYGDNGADAIAQPVGGGGHVLADLTGTSEGTGSTATDGNGNEHWLVNNIGNSWFDGAEVPGVTGNAMIFPTVDGEVWLVGPTAINSATEAVFKGMVGSFSTVTVTGLPAYSDEVFAFHYQDADHDHFVLGWNGVLYRINRADGAILGSYAPAYPSGLWPSGFQAIPAGATTFWVGFEEISSVDLSQVRQLDRRDWVGGAGVNTRTIYDPINHALIDGWNSDPKRWFYLDRVSGAAVTLQTIVENVATVAKVAASDIDASALTQAIPGYSVTQGSGKDWTEPLLDLYDSDPRPHGFQLQFVRRGGAAGATISHEKFALPESGGAGGDGGRTYDFARSGGTDVPIMVRMNFADVDADHQPNEADSPLISSTDGKGVVTLDMSRLALDVDTARQLVARYHRRKVMDRLPYRFALSAREAALEPADVHPVALRGVTETMRGVSLELGADGRIATEWRRDDPSIALLDGAAGAAYDGRNPSVVAVPVISKGFVLDVPLLADADNDVNPLLYVAAGPYAAGAWPGAAIFQETGGEYTDEIASVASNAMATWGYATGALADVPSPWCWDRGNSVNVLLQVGTLTGCTEADVDADPRLNLCLLGDELLNFTTATLEGDGSYTLSGFKRGRRGTEWATAGHAAGDTFLLLDTADAVELGLSDVGTNLSFKAATEGRTATGAFPIDIEPFTGASLKPRAPCHLRAVRDDATGDWIFTWVRRTRVGGYWTGGTTIPLSEASEEYELEILNGASVVRPVLALSSPTWTYSAANQTTDFGAPLLSAPDWRAYQISDAVGRGYVAEAA